MSEASRAVPTAEMEELRLEGCREVPEGSFTDWCSQDSNGSPLVLETDSAEHLEATACVMGTPLTLRDEATNLACEGNPRGKRCPYLPRSHFLSPRIVSVPTGPLHCYQLQLPETL